MSAPRFHGPEKHPMLRNAFQRNAFLICKISNIHLSGGVGS